MQTCFKLNFNQKSQYFPTITINYSNLKFISSIINFGHQHFQEVSFDLVNFLFIPLFQFPIFLKLQVILPFIQTFINFVNYCLNYLKIPKHDLLIHFSLLLLNFLMLMQILIPMIIACYFFINFLNIIKLILQQSIQLIFLIINFYCCNIQVKCCKCYFTEVLLEYL